MRFPSQGCTLSNERVANGAQRITSIMLEVSYDLRYRAPGSIRPLNISIHSGQKTVIQRACCRWEHMAPQKQLQTNHRLQRLECREGQDLMMQVASPD